MVESQGTVNLFMVYSPLHCLCAEQIVRHFEPSARNVVFYLKPGFASLLDSSLWEGIHYLPWPRLDPLPGPLGRLRQARKNLDLVANECRGAEIIRLHTTVIDSEAINYHINHLRASFPTADFSVRLFPDGVLNVQRHPLGLLGELFHYTRLLRRLASPALHYYTFRGDRTGSDAAIVDRIYILHRFPHEYPAGKIVELPPFRQATAASSLGQTKRVLVLGQPVVAFRRMTAETMHTVTDELAAFIAAAGFTDVWYKAHPRDTQREFAAPGYRDLTMSVSLEQHLVEEHYDMVVGIYSTGLLTARMILPDTVRVVAYGMNRIRFRSRKEREALCRVFTTFGVELVPCEPR